MANHGQVSEARMGLYSMRATARCSFVGAVAIAGGFIVLALCGCISATGKPSNADLAGAEGPDGDVGDFAFVSCGSGGCSNGHTCNAAADCASASCSRGLCCAPGAANCDGNAANGCETDLQHDVANCGACGAKFDETACNGVDDNCDGRVDEGCPESIALDFTKPVVLAWHGSAGSPTFGPWPQPAAPSHAMNGRGGCGIDSLSPIAGAAALKVVTSTTPYSYSVELPSTAPGGPWGGTGGGGTMVACSAEDEVLNGISGKTSSLYGLNELQGACAAIRVEGDKPFHFTVTVVSDGKIGPIGGASGTSCGSASTPAFDDPCPDGHVVGQWEGETYRFSSTTTLVHRVRVTCYPLVLTLKE